MLGRLTQFKKKQALADRLEAPFQLLNDPLHLVVTEMVGEAMHANQHAYTSELNLSGPLKVLQAIKGFKVSKVPCPNSIPNRVLRHIPKHVMTFFTKVFVSPQAVLPASLEAHTHFIHTEVGEGPSHVAFFVQIR